MKEYEELLLTSIQAALEAGRVILEVYNTNFKVEHKADDSPLTLADQRSHDIIAGHLEPFGIPLLSEEGKEIPYLERKKWDTLWVVDPLDGTKEFVNRNGEFTVNIALIKNGRPIWGVIYLPVKDVLYFATQETGSFQIETAATVLNQDKKLPGMEKLCQYAQKLPFHRPSKDVFTIIGSRSHPSAELEAFVDQMGKKHRNVEFMPAGSSLKFCRVAEGKANIYPRFGPTMEWDTAAGQAIAENAGRSVTHYETGEPLLYNKENLLNPWFVVK